MQGYIKKIQDIVQVGFSSLKWVIFRWKRWHSFNQNNVKEYCDSGLICINSKNMWDEKKKLYVYQKHCKQVLFYPYILDIDWWLIQIIHYLTSKHIFENNNVIIPNEEDNLNNGNE